MLSAANFRPSTVSPSHGSRTLTINDAPPVPSGDDASNDPEAPGSSGVLRLRGAPNPSSRPRVVWDDKVVDNENCGRKKSKICCIYHKPKAYDESSSEEDSSDSDSDSSCGGHGARPSAHYHRSHNHNHASSSRHPEHIHTVESVQPEPERNAYESSRKDKQKA